ncbi:MULTISPECIES: DUF4114 domain-containing protein [Calothrix]|uniref:DUF11 domain-containing protein n=2 Tax=Calothrix TaxID=1186 RepID=A0ABR8A2P0_9CYAN|nr:MULTISPECIES: DUF4114 domain-containing protein [Calothrix]MBD2194135.1 DUF11 domain-containing protein [Calothrix parietina FACHB-288]MBD2229233.1 DUF11 domain-containing protein [Calothrix anomala FACHB-343]
MSANYSFLSNDSDKQSNNVIKSALELAKNQLYSFANSPDFQPEMQLVFGLGVNTTGIQNAWQNQDFSIIPDIQIRSGAELAGAVGAYAQATNTIYVSQGYLNQNTANSSAITSVLLEEIGHAIDAKLNQVDAPGDEGAIFSGLVQGKTFESEQLQQLQAKDDTAIITLDGQELVVEQATTGFVSGGFEGSVKTIKLDSKGGGTATYFYEMYTIPDNLILRYEGKDILNTGFVSGSKTGTVNIPKGNSDELQVILATNDEGTAWDYKIDTKNCPEPLPFKISLVNGTEEEKNGKCILQGTINIGRQGFFPMLQVEGTVEYDANKITVDGIVSSLIGAGLVKTTPLFKSKFDIDVKTATGSLEEDKSFANQYQLGGMDVDFSSLSINPNGLALGAKFKLIEDLGLPDYFFSGSDGLLITQNDVKLGSSIKFSIPNFKDFQLFKFFPVREFNDFSIEYLAPEDKVKIKGKLVIDPFAKPDGSAGQIGKIIADFSGDNYIQIQGGKGDVKGSLSVSNIKLPNGWGISEATLKLDTVNKDIAGKAKVTFPFGASVPPKKIGAGLELGFKLPIPPVELNLIGAEVDGLNVPIGNTGAFLQGLSGKIENFAPSDQDPIEFTGGLKLTAGPKVPADLTAIGGGKFEAALVDLDATVNVNEKRIKGSGKFKMINEQVASGNVDAEINWNKGFFETKGGYSLIDGLIKTQSGFKASTNFDITMSGGASVNIPKFVPFLGGAQISSGNFLFNFTNNGNLSDDFGAAWRTINIQKLGLNLSFVGGFKAFFDGKVEIIGSKNLPKTSSFTIAPGTDWILMGADWENANDNVKVKVKAPDGTIFNESDFAVTGKIAIVDELTNSTTRVVIVSNPEPGIWDIDAVDETGLGQVTYSAFRDSIAPTIAITSPSTDITDQNVTISYNAFDADSNAKVSLFYDTDNEGFDGILIKDGLDETDGAGSFVWNTEGIATGDYYIYGMIMDENNPISLNYSTGQVKVTEEADLSVTKTTNTDSVNVGSNLTYTITVTNNGTSTAKSIVLSDILPEGVSFVSSSINPTTQSDNQLTFDIGDLEKDQKKTVNITITPPTTGTITNTATVTTKTYDPDVTNNVAIVDTTVAEVPLLPTDLLLTSNATNTPVNLGDTITYTLTVTNNGNSQATGVKLIDDIGSLGVKDVSAIASQGNTFVDFNGNVVAELGNIDKGGKATVTINATAITADTLRNTAIVTSNESDSNTSDNYLSQSKTINSIAPDSADLELTLAVDKENPNVGDQLTFTLTITNKGTGIASSIKVANLLPTGLSFISATPEQGTYDSITGVWDVGNIRDNVSRSLTIIANVETANALINKAEVTGVSETDPDSTPNNNNPNEDDQASVTLNAALAITTLTKISDNVFTIIGGANKPKLQVTLTESNSNQINELGVFTVDDAQGKINGIAPGEAGYIQAALNKSKVVFSTIANVPNGFNIKNLKSILEFNFGDNLRFFLVKNGTIDSVQNGITPTTDILFSDISRQTITELGTDGFSLAWKDGSNNNADFKDLVVNIKSTNDPLLLGTNLQGTRQGEVIDLQGINQDVKVDFVVNREAAFSNFVGLYKVADENGGIDIDGNGTIDFRPGDSGYAQAAVKNRVAGIDLRVDNQGTATFTDKLLTGGSIFAPFILTNGRTVDQVLNGQVDQIYFAYLGANSDKVDHIRLLGNNTFGFEDLPGGGDNDFNDVIVRAELTL